MGEFYDYRAAYSMFIIFFIIGVPLSYLLFRNNTFMNNNKFKILIIALILLTIVDKTDENSKTKTNILFYLTVLSVILMYISVALIIFNRQNKIIQQVNLNGGSA
jgi:hypothetical protein